jgi:hypothetical protein
VESVACLDAGIPAEEHKPWKRPLVLGAVVGFLIGSTVIGILWGASGMHAGANDDAIAACTALARAGDLPTTVDGAGQVTTTALLATGVLHRITAARELASAAAEANRAYRELADHIDSVSRMVISLHFNDPSGHRHLEQARQICARI